MINAYHQAMKAQWLSRDKIRELQERKLRQVVQQAFKNVPFYKRLFEEAGISPDCINTLEDMERVPITDKSTLQRFDRNFILSQAFSTADLKTERSSGSTGSPFSVFLDRKDIYLRNALFLRALRTAGYRFGRKILLVTGAGKKKMSKPWLNWHYASILDPPEALLTRLNRFKPEFLYGCTTCLRLLAEFVRCTNSWAFTPSKIITTAEMLDNRTKKLLEETFEAEIYDLYGMTETGIVGWECSEHNGYHLAEDSTIVEYLPIQNGGKASRLVMTKLDLAAMPLIRFDTGDLGIPNPESSCACGRGFKLLKKVEGRIIDCLCQQDGTTVSPYKITCALEKLPNLLRFQVIQEDYARITVRVQTALRSNQRVEHDIQKVMASLLGPEVQVTVLQVVNMQTIPGRKFRVVVSKLSDNQN